MSRISSLMGGVLVCFCVLGAPAAHGQTGRWGIIVNEATSTCARYWEGNSCTRVLAPQGWTPLLPSWDSEKQALVLKYKDSSCLFSSVRAEGCCRQFNLTWDSQFRAPQERTGKENDPNSECYALPSPRQP